MLGLLLPLSLLALTQCRVTFDKAELLDHRDLLSGTTTPFSCPKGCSVFSPSHTTSIKVADDKGIVYFSLANVSSSAGTKGFTLSPGNYQLKNTDFYTAEFTFYVVQKDAVNFDVPVYTTPGKVGVSNQRYVTFLSDMPGFRIKDISGDLSNDPVRIYATGAQGLGCKPVYTARSSDNAARSTLSILGPIATIDFGSSKNVHYATFAGDYSTIYYDVGTTSIYVSPGYVGCGTQLYTNDYITKVQQNIKAQKNEGMCVNVYADYAISSYNSALSITVNDEDLRLMDTGVLDKQYYDTAFNVSLLWNRQGDRDPTQFAVQIDLLAKADCGKNG